MKLHKCAASDQLRPVMCHILIDDKYCVASDAHVIVKIPREQLLEENVPNCFVRSEDWAKLVKAKPFTFMIHYEENHLVSRRIRDRYEIARCKPIEYEKIGNYPNYAVVYNDFKPKEMLEIGIYASKILMICEGLGTSRLKFEFSGSDHGVLVTCLEEEFYGRVGIIMPYMINNKYS
jgi:hypothetical protein